MNRKAAWITAVAVAAALAWNASPADAGRGKMGFRPGGGLEGSRMERMAERLDLTEDQQKSIEKIHDDGRSEMAALQKRIAKAKLELKSEMLNDKPDASNLRMLTKKIGDLKTEKQLMRLEHRIAMREIMTEEQREMMFLGHHGFGHGGFGHGGFGCCDGDGRRGPFGDYDGDGPHRRRPGHGQGGGRGHGGMWR